MKNNSYKFLLNSIPYIIVLFLVSLVASIAILGYNMNKVNDRLAGYEEFVIQVKRGTIPLATFTDEEGNTTETPLFQIILNSLGRTK